MLKLMYITNDPKVALIAEKYGVDRVWIDLETLGKEERQKGMNTVKSNHQISDIKKIAPLLTKSEMLVRVNPWNDNSKKEINDVIEAGAELVMLPMWKSVEDVKNFLDVVDGRTKTVLLLETKEAVECLDDVLKLKGIDEIHIGLNDLHLSYGLTFMFELLSNGIVENLCNKIKKSGIPYGFGGIAKLGGGDLPAEKIIMEHYRLGSTRAILSRSFCNTSLITDINEIDFTFKENLRILREFEDSLKNISEEEFNKNKVEVKIGVEKIVEKKKDMLNEERILTLKKKHGEAFYLLDTKQFRSNFIELKNSFLAKYPNFNIAYSYKTNYIPKLCKIVNELGGYAEVVSEMELELALKIGVQYNKIIWNGPVKNNEVLKEFLINGGTVNIDCFEEAMFIKNIANDTNKIINVGVRCNFDVKDNVVSRFGLDIDSEEFINVLELIKNSNNINLINLQCHFAKRQIDYWPNRAKGMIKLIDKIGVVPPRIDLGGGLYGKMDDSLKAQFNYKIPTYNDYANAVMPILNDYFKNKKEKPEIIIEPGSALVGDCMKFIGTVKTIKCVRGKYFATVLGSQKNISMTGVNPPIKVLFTGDNHNNYNDLDIVGFTCIEGDILYKNYNGKLGIGDTIVISNCGSYSIVMKPPFILPNFPILEIDGNDVKVIKNKETFDDIFRTYNF